MAGDGFFWERQKHEPWKCYERFQAYRDLPKSRRNYKRVAEQFGVSLKRISNIGRRWMWVARVEAYEAEMDRIAMLEQVEDRKRAYKRQMNVSRAMGNIVAQALSELDPSSLTPNQITHMAEVQAKMERLALGQATEQFEHSFGGAGRISDDMGDVVDDPELRRAAVAFLQQPAESGEGKSGGSS